MQVPIWFCVACPAVLGLLAPLVINAGLGALADAACRHWQLPAEECNDLWCVMAHAFAIFNPSGCAPDAGSLALDNDGHGVQVHDMSRVHAPDWVPYGLTWSAGSMCSIMQMTSLHLCAGMAPLPLGWCSAWLLRCQLCLSAACQSAPTVSRAPGYVRV